jgi:DNA polymerase-1
MSEQQEMENKVWQQTRLIEYYNSTPIIQFMFKGTEADDIIAYISQMKKLRMAEKLIVSSDKDFFQLLSSKTIQYRPIQKEILNQNSIVEKFNIHPNNFAMARAMVGDKSDNIDGIAGLGLKTIAKRCPFLKEGKAATFEDLTNYCEERLENCNTKAYQKVLDHGDLLRRNYHMMQLYAPTLSIDAKKMIRRVFEDPDTSFNKTELIKMMMKDGFGEINFIELFQHFNKISIDNR